MGPHVGCEPAGTVPGLLNMAFALWRPTGSGYSLKKPCAHHLLKITAAGNARGPVSAAGDDRGRRAVLGRHKAGNAETCTSLTTISNFIFPFSVQNVLAMTVSHDGYTDPNNLMFTEIKVLGVPTSITQVTISQNGETITSPHSVDYNTTKKVRCHLQGNATFTTAYALLNISGFNSQCNTIFKIYFSKIHKLPSGNDCIIHSLIYSKYCAVNVEELLRIEITAEEHKLLLTVEKWWILVCACFPLFLIVYLKLVTFEGRKSNYTTRIFISLCMTLLLSVLSDNVFISQPCLPTTISYSVMSYFGCRHCNTGFLHVQVKSHFF